LPGQAQKGNVMLKYIEISQAIGKTIQATGDAEDDLVIVFTDGTYARLHSTTGYDGDRECPEDGGAFGIRSSCYLDTLIKLGIFTNDEVKADKLAQQAEQEANRKAEERRRANQERATYERLKRKFEST
jgi:hypothetical protein